MSKNKSTAFLTAFVAVAAVVAAIPMTAGAAYTSVVQTIDGIEWKLQLDPTTGSATLGYGGSFTESAYACPNVALNAANIPWTFVGDDGIHYTVTKIAQAAFSNHSNLTGTLTIPDDLSGWTVKVDGVTMPPRFALLRQGNTLVAGCVQGTMVIFR